MISQDIKDLRIQPPKTETPLAHMTVGTFEVRTADFVRWIDVPTTAALVGNKR